MRDISMHILDIVGNSVRAKASLIEILIEEKSADDVLILTIKDNGCGMDEDTIKLATDPFFTSRKTRRVGLGIPLLQQNARQTGGDLIIESQPGKGTVIKASFVISNIDMLPLGDLPGVIGLCVSGNPNVNFCFKYNKGYESYEFNTIDVRKVLGDIELFHPEVIRSLRQMIFEGLKEVGADF